MKSVIVIIAEPFLLTPQEYKSSIAFLLTVVLARSASSATLLHAKHKQKTPANHEKWRPHFDSLLKSKEEHGNIKVMVEDRKEWLKGNQKQYSIS